MDQNRLTNYFKLAYERTHIAVKKGLGWSKPWTKLPIFQQYYFTNVFRDHDKTTIALMDYIIRPHSDNFSIEKWKLIMLFRFISRIDVYKDLVPDIKSTYALERIWATLKMRKENKQPIVTNAFVCNSKIPGGWTDKITYIFKLLKVVEEQYNNFDELLRTYNSLERIYNILIYMPGIGPFMAYEYVTDFSYDEEYLKSAPDVYTWAGCGLGAMRGLSRVLVGHPGKNFHSDYLGLFQDIYELWKLYIKDTLSIQIGQYADSTEKEYASHVFSRFERLTMRDVEHWLCEYDKYCRGGSKKRKYQGVLS